MRADEHRVADDEPAVDRAVHHVLERDDAELRRVPARVRGVVVRRRRGRRRVVHRHPTPAVHGHDAISQRRRQDEAIALATELREIGPLLPRGGDERQ